MTNHEAIQFLDNIKHEETGRAIGKDGFYAELMGYHVQALNMAIKALSSSEKPNKWIPVSERLPEALRYVNCTCHSLVDDREDWVVETFYAPQPYNSPYSDWGDIPMLNRCECEVIAWMYRDIPKPYKASPTGEEAKE